MRKFLPDNIWPRPNDVMELFEIGMDRPDAATQWVSPPQGVWLNLGAGKKLVEGSKPVDLPEWDANQDRIPFDTQRVDGIYAFHFLEHVDRPIDVLIDCQRVLKPGGVMNIVVPYGAEDCWLQDLTHKHVFIEDTWKNLFNNPYYDRRGMEGFRWKFEVTFNMVMGLNRRNLVLVTQLQKGQ